MCQDCGCSEIQAIAINGVVQAPLPPDASVPHAHSHSHSHPHTHSHPPGDAEPQTLQVQAALLSKNDRFAERNRGYFSAKHLLVLNILSSPGAGKTALIERLIRETAAGAPSGRSPRVGVIVGDLETDEDARRLRQAGAPAVQITTGTACHLEADMVAQAMEQLDLDALDWLIVENVGNLVCPAAYDLGETLRVVLLSTTEGEEKPLKYPTAFKSADVVVINKIDIAKAVGFDRGRAIANIRVMAPQARLFEVSARTGQGIEPLIQYLGSQGRSPQAVAGGQSWPAYG